MLNYLNYSPYYIVIVILTFLLFLWLSSNFFLDVGESLKSFIKQIPLIIIAAAIITFITALVGTYIHYTEVVGSNTLDSVKKEYGRGAVTFDFTNNYKDGRYVEYTVFTGDVDDSSEYTNKNFYKTVRVNVDSLEIVDNFEPELDIEKLQKKLDNKVGKIPE